MPPKQTNPTLDAPTLSGRTQNIEPYIETPEKRTLTGLGNVTDYEYFDMLGYEESVSRVLVGSSAAGIVTLTVEAAAQDDGTVPASADYEDVTALLTVDGSTGTVSVITSAGAAENHTFLDFSAIMGTYRYVRIKYVITGSSADVDITIHHRRIGRVA